MTVYVDDMRAKYGRMVMCHMIADTDSELQGMAVRIGVKLRWHQGDHFDICLEKRAEAVRAGAIEITQRQCCAMRIRAREAGNLGNSSDAVSWLKARLKSKRML